MAKGKPLGFDVIGFQGNSDLYGVGIRIGYYTAALSLWISNLWAPTETYFLRPITLTFLVALVIGVAVLSRNPEKTYAIEPFMMMQVAYDTFNMGLYGPPAAELLVWENNYFTLFITSFVGLTLYGYDTWYWWVGKDKMMKTPGPSGTTLGLFVYFGTLDLFSWIRWPMRLFLIAMVLCLGLNLAVHLVYRSTQKRMDHLVTPQRLEDLAGGWMRDMGIVVSKNGGIVQRGVIATGVGTISGTDEKEKRGSQGALSRNVSSKSSLKANIRPDYARSASLGADIGNTDEKDYYKEKDRGREGSNSSTGFDDTKDMDRSTSEDAIDKDSDKLSTVNEHPRHSPSGSLHHAHHHHVSPPPPVAFPTVVRSPTNESSEPRPLLRTMSDRFRYAFLGWKPDGNVVGGSHLPTFLMPRSINSLPPEPSSYTPHIETLVAAQEILLAVNVRHFRDWNIKYWQIPLLPFITMRIAWQHIADMIYCGVQLPFALWKYGCRPGFLLALMAHGSFLRWTKCIGWTRYLLRAIRHPVYRIKSVEREDILLASRIYLSLNPPPKPTRTTILFWAYLNFSICSLLVIGTELAISWNKIQGVQTISSVGQLIPAAIGVGGLLKVLYTAIYEKDAEIDLCFGRCRGILRRARWKEASEWFERAAGEWERRREIRGSPMEKEEEDKRREREKKLKAEDSKYQEEEIQTEKKRFAWLMPWKMVNKWKKSKQNA